MLTIPVAALNKKSEPIFVNRLTSRTLAYWVHLLEQCEVEDRQDGLEVGMLQDMHFQHLQRKYVEHSRQ